MTAQPSFDQYNFSVKGDHNFNDAHKVSGVYNYTARPRVTLWSVRAEELAMLLNGLDPA